MSNRERKYLGEIHHGFRLVVVSDKDSFTGKIENVQRLGARVDLAPALPDDFDWGRVGNALRCERLAVAMLADALRDSPDGDELAVKLAGEFLETTVRELGHSEQDEPGFKIGAAAIERWAAETAVRRGFRDCDGRVVARQAAADLRRAV